MLRLQRITTADTALYSYMEQLMVTSFPPEEYRNLTQLREYTDGKKHFYNNIIFDNDLAVGFITYWDFDKFYYAEHFAVDPARRNGGYGKKTLECLCQLLQRPNVKASSCGNMIINNHRTSLEIPICPCYSWSMAIWIAKKILRP